jgi:post-segregation antitoxin (ccd killing protein)
MTALVDSMRITCAVRPIHTHPIHTAVERKNVTIREDQSEWVDKTGVNLSRLVQEAIDERMEPTETELAEAYQKNAAHAAETNTEWSGVSAEANEQLGDHPDHE